MNFSPDITSHARRILQRAGLAFAVFSLLITVVRAHALENPPGRSGGEGDSPPREAAADPYEPNGDRASAPWLEWTRPGDGSWWTARTEGAVLGSVTDFDFFRLELAAGDSLSAVLLDSDGAEAEGLLLSLLDSDGVVLSGNAAEPAAVAARAGYTGFYYLLVNDLSLLEGGSFAAAEKPYVLSASRMRRGGDMDGDGDLDYRDAFLVFLVAGGLRGAEVFTSAQITAADLDGDGVSAGDMDDFRLILGLVAGLPQRDPSLPDKEKTPASAPLLSAAGNGGWLVGFPDGSSVHLDAGGEASVIKPGAAASRLLAAGGLPRASGPPASAQPGAELLASSPNPFNPSTSISFRLSRPESVALTVFDTRGRVVRTLYHGAAGAGLHTVHWDGTDSRGRGVASGVYLYCLEAENIRLVRKMVLLK